MGRKYEVHHAFAYDNVYYTNENIDGLPAEVVDDRIKRGYISEVNQGTPQGTDLSGVPFASIEATEAAQAAGLTPASFENREQSSDRGFTVGDVRIISEEG